MTRCLDCGSQRIADQCPACGLTSAAAEVMFRRRLWRRTSLFLAGSLLFPYVSQIYPRRARNRKEIEVLKRIYSGFIPLPWILAATLLVNGRLDSPKNIVYHPTIVVGSFNMKGIVRGSRRLLVRSWREGQRVERLAVDLDDFDRFHVGDAVTVAIEPGALGIPWYYGVYRR
jgi:hypothetical protein